MAVANALAYYDTATITDVKKITVEDVLIFQNLFLFDLNEGSR